MGHLPGGRQSARRLRSFGAIDGSRSIARSVTERWPAEIGRTLVIMPAKDESATLPELLERLASVHPPSDTLVVDDGSNDATPVIARHAGCRVVSHAFNIGYGAALLTGYHYALRNDYSYIVQMDADGQHPPEAISNLLQPVFEDDADLVVGSRWLSPDTEPQGSLRRLAARGLAWMATLWTGQRITDPTSGFQAISPTALAHLCSDGFPEDYPDVDVLIGLHRSGIRLAEVPVTMAARANGSSMHAGLRVLYYFYRLAVCLLLLPVRRTSPYRSQRPRR